MKETSSEACQGRAQFQLHQAMSCHQVFFLQGKVLKEIHATLTETLACFLPGQAKDLSASHISIFTPGFPKNHSMFGVLSLLLHAQLLLCQTVH